MLDRLRVRKIIETALDEDIGAGDVTSNTIIREDARGRAKAIAKSELLVAGIEVFKEVFLCLDADVSFDRCVKDGSEAEKGEVLIVAEGPLRSIITAERTALNFLQRMCGIATMTEKFVEAVRGTNTRILDTRKTVPGLRYLDKYAVRMAGGHNHRTGLDGGVLIKENHIAVAGGIAEAVKRVRSAAPVTLKIEVEVTSPEEAENALQAGADIIMLDNMDIGAMKETVQMIGGKALVEASGNVSIDNVFEIAQTGVDFISIGSLTHSVFASDISLLIER